MTLCEGDTPVIVDQPEDSLDIRSIWDDMCLRLRQSKRSRQFIFTTHNSSLAVASDSDKFVVLTADARRAQVAMAGAIDGEQVRQHVIDCLRAAKTRTSSSSASTTSLTCRTTRSGARNRLTSRAQMPAPYDRFSLRAAFGRRHRSGDLCAGGL